MSEIIPSILIEEQKKTDSTLTVENIISSIIKRHNKPKQTVMGGLEEIQKQLSALTDAREYFEITTDAVLNKEAILAPLVTFDNLEKKYKILSIVYGVMAAVVLLLIGIFVGIIVAVIDIGNVTAENWWGIAKYTLVIGAVVSLGGYALKQLIKLFMTANHLMIDAIERKNVLQVYLGLKKIGEIEVEDRTLMLQAILSKAESGLIKGDREVNPKTNINLNLDKFKID